MSEKIKTVNLEEMVEIMAEKFEMPKKTAKEFIKAYEEEKLAIAERGDKFTIVGFGTFQRKFRNATTSRNPRAAQNPELPTMIEVPAKYAFTFSPGKTVKERFKAIPVDPADLNSK